MVHAPFTECAGRPGVGLAQLALALPLDRRARLVLKAELAAARATVN